MDPMWLPMIGSPLNGSPMSSHALGSADGPPWDLVVWGHQVWCCPGEGPWQWSFMLPSGAGIHGLASVTLWAHWDTICGTVSTLRFYSCWVAHISELLVQVLDLALAEGRGHDSWVSWGQVALVGGLANELHWRHTRLCLFGCPLVSPCGWGFRTLE